MNDKTYKSITEVSKLLKINKHVIRYWDSRFTGISTRLGNKKRRFFSLKNIQKLNEIKNILHKDGKSLYSLGLAEKLINKRNFIKDNNKTGSNLNINKLITFSGAINVFKQLSPKTKIIGIEPLGAPAMKTSINNNKNTTLKSIDGFVDGAAVKRVGEISFNFCKKYLDDLILIDEGEICQSILDLEKYHSIVAEPAGAMSNAALNIYSSKISIFFPIFDFL